MEHSIEDYLRRCTKEKLYKIIYGYLYQEDSDAYEETILLILDILWERQELFPEDIPIELVLKWEQRYF